MWDDYLRNQTLKIGDKADAGQQAGRTIFKNCAQTARHALGIDEEINAGQGFGWLSGKPVKKAVNQSLRKVYTCG
ncbi:hypothetical protein Z949_3646 [Sulfitobacter guttiformis KCTC 32187]|nr:hypothetical protein Z949_3646 [Sulfitobacter guttiformis KCTC 32187]